MAAARGKGPTRQPMNRPLIGPVTTSGSPLLAVPEQRSPNVPIRLHDLEVRLGDNAEVRPLAFDSCGVFLGVLRRLVLRKSRELLPRLATEEQVWTKLKSHLVKEDPNDTTGLLFGQGQVDVLTTCPSTLFRRLELDVPDDAVVFEDDVVPGVVNLRPTNFERAVVKPPRSLQHFSDEEMFDQLLAKRGVNEVLFHGRSLYHEYGTRQSLFAGAGSAKRRWCV